MRFKATLTKKARKRLGRLRMGHRTVAVAVTQNGATERLTQAVTLKR